MNDRDKLQALREALSTFKRVAAINSDEFENALGAMRELLDGFTLLSEQIGSQLAELDARDGDVMAGDGYVTREEVCAHFAISPQTVVAWGKDRDFPAPLGGWNADGEKRAVLRFRKSDIRTWRARMHGETVKENVMKMDAHGKTLLTTKTY